MVSYLGSGRPEKSIEPPVSMRADDDEIGVGTARSVTDGLPWNADGHLGLSLDALWNVRSTLGEVATRSAFEHVDEWLLGGLPEILWYVGR